MPPINDNKRSWDVSAPVETVEAVDPADAPLFMANNFWTGGDTAEARLDEIHAMRNSLITGQSEVMGDTSANELVTEILSRARLLDHRKYAELKKAFADALVKLAGDYPSKWLNAQWDTPSRAVLYQNLPSDAQRGPGTVNNLPSDEQILRDGKPPVETESKYGYADDDDVKKATTPPAMHPQSGMDDLDLPKID